MYFNPRNFIGHGSAKDLQDAVDGMEWYGQTTAVSCALVEAGNQMNTNDNINDVLIGMTNSL